MTDILSIADSPPAVVDVHDKVADAVKTMTEHKVGAAAVVEDGKLKGIFTERDIMLRVVRTGLDPTITPVAEVMTPHVQCIDCKAEAGDALKLMLKSRFRHLPVCDADGGVVGMLSSRHVLRREVDRLFGELDSLEAFLTVDGPGG